MMWREFDGKGLLHIDGISFPNPIAKAVLTHITSNSKGIFALPTPL